jgi:hypothetical protein
VHKSSRVPNLVDLQEDRISAPHALGALPSEDELLLEDTIQLLDQALNDAIR